MTLVSSPLDELQPLHHGSGHRGEEAKDADKLRTYYMSCLPQPPHSPPVPNMQTGKRHHAFSTLRYISLTKAKRPNSTTSIALQVLTAGKEIPDNLNIIELLQERKQQLTVWCTTCNKFAGQGCDDHNYISVKTMLSDSFKKL